MGLAPSLKRLHRRQESGEMGARRNESKKRREQMPRLTRWKRALGQNGIKDLVIRFFSCFRFYLLVLEEATVSSCILQASRPCRSGAFCESSHAWKMHPRRGAVHEDKRNHVKRR